MLLVLVGVSYILEKLVEEEEDCRNLEGFETKNECARKEEDG